LCLILATSFVASGPALASGSRSSVVRAGRPLVAALAPMPGYTGSGVAHLTDNPGQQRICSTITTKNVTVPIMAAHIHAASTGNVVVPLFTSTTNAMATTFRSCVHAPRSPAKAILMHPSRYFVMVHTSGMTPILKGTLAKPNNS
ncbi:MAG TPA: CHRD domain-containing protein, partial [Chloroflexota bacterium]